MKLTIATPAYGGQVTTGYCGSLVQTTKMLREHNIPFELILLDNESLITRARNKIASRFLMSDSTHLLFIDADIAWTPDQLLSLLNNSADNRIIGGSYPVKSYPIRLSLNVADSSREINPEDPLVEMKHLPTGFMLIPVIILRNLQKRVKSFRGTCPLTQREILMYDFFPCGPHEDHYESEDWAFSRMVRESGFGLYLDTKCILPHTGTHTFRPEVRHE